ncbi:MAG: hypothetical protein IPK07_25985 [Deltaproteobacteria bacterium]|nr:hypothetical protein [Deltaproteobacteria bacterium]
MKLTTIGHSTGVVLAKEALKRLHVGKGDTLVLVATQDEIELTHVDPEVASQFAEPERIMREGRDVLRQAGGVGRWAGIRPGHAPRSSRRFIAGGSRSTAAIRACEIVRCSSRRSGDRGTAACSGADARPRT